MRVFGKLSPFKKKRAFFIIGVFLVIMVPVNTWLIHCNSCARLLTNVTYLCVAFVCVVNSLSLKNQWKAFTFDLGSKFTLKVVSDSGVVVKDVCFFKTLTRIS